MLDTYLNMDAALSAVASNYLTCLGLFWHFVGVILGGLVIWVGLVLARYLSNGCTFKTFRRRR